MEAADHALQEIKILLERGRCPVPNLLRMPFVCVGLDWARPKFLFHLIALIKWSGSCRTDRSKSHWKQNQRANKEEEAFQKKTQSRSTKL